MINDFSRKIIYIRSSKGGDARFIIVTNILWKMICKLSRIDIQLIFFQKKKKTFEEYGSINA